MSYEYQLGLADTQQWGLVSLPNVSLAIRLHSEKYKVLRRLVRAVLLNTCLSDCIHTRLVTFQL